MKLPSLPNPNLKLSLGRRSSGDVVGLDIQPGFVAAVRARVNGAIVVERAATMALGPDVMRDGEVIDEKGLAEALAELFATSGLGKRVRVGVANQRTVLRTLELPPVTDEKELAAAVGFQAQDQVPMPLANAVMDFHPLGIVDTPAGPRQRVVLVAAQRDMIERLLRAVRAAGLSPEGVDLSAFALIRSLYRREDDGGRVLYLNVDGLTNLAIAEGTVCRFTRVVGGGLEAMATELAERRGIALADARELLAAADLTAGPAEAQAVEAPAPTEPVQTAEAPAGAAHEEIDAAAAPSDQTPEAHDAEASLGHESELEMSYEELAAVPVAPAPPAEEVPASDVFMVLENGIRELSGEVRNSLDFHRSQDGGGDVSCVVLSGAAQDIPGFAEALGSSLGVEVRPAAVKVVAEEAAARVSPHRLAVATGLSTTEAPQ